MNKVFLMGRLTRDPEIRYPANPDAKSVGRFSIAVDRRFKRDGEPTADFFNCVCFGKLAEFTEKYLRKGSKILVEGSIHNNDYTNKDGQKVYSLQVTLDSIEFAESKSSGSSPAPSDGYMDIPDGIDEDIPFK